MRHIVTVSGTKIALTSAQYEAMVDILRDAEVLEDKHVGKGKGTHGYDNTYIMAIHTKPLHDWLTSQPMPDDYVGAIKLAVKLLESN
jgi:hypothetical protein